MAEVAKLTHEQVGTDGELNDDRTNVETIKKLKKESMNARWPREMEWNRAWNLYNNIYDYTKKAEWQSKSGIPRVNTAVRAGTYLLKRGLVGERDFFRTDGVGDLSKMMAPYAHKLAKYHLTKSKFVDKYVTSLMSGMLTGAVIMKVYPRMVNEDSVQFDWPRGGPAAPRSVPGYTNMVGDALSDGTSRVKRSKKQRLKVETDPISAYDYNKDPYGKGLYKIHTIEMDWHEYKELEDSSPYFEKGLADKLSEDFINVEREQQESYREGQYPPSGAQRIRKRVTIDEFWGWLPDANGATLFKNCYCVMVNEKYMGVKPRPSPYLPMGFADPFVEAPMIERPFSVWNQSFIESVCGIATTLTELMNMIVDGNMFASVKAFELDIDQVYNPADFQHGVFPGKIYAKRGGGMGTSPMLRDISLGNFNPQVLDLFMAMDREFQSGTGLNEFITPQMRSRGSGRTTATEFSMKGKESADFFGEIAKCQEQKLVEPVLERIYRCTVFYQRDFTDPMLMELLGPDTAMKAQTLLMDPDIREFLLGNPMLFKAGGMTEIASRAQQLDKIMAFINLVGNIGKVMPAIFQRVNMEAMLRKAVEGLNWNESEILNMGGPMPPPPEALAGGPEGAPQAAPGGSAPAGLPPVSAPLPNPGVMGHTGMLNSVLGG